MVFTLDALHTNKKTARLITEDLHAHYVLTLKGNQPNALPAAHAALSGTNADWVQSSAVEATVVTVSPAAIMGSGAILVMPLTRSDRL